MTRETISDAITNISTEYIEKAADYSVVKKVHKPIWLKWGVTAACFALVAVIAFGTLQSTFWSSKHSVTLDNGSTIEFAKSNTAGVGQFDVKRAGVESHKLTDAEIDLLFNELPVSGVTYVDAESGQFVAFEGNMGDVTLAITAPGEFIMDAIIDGETTTSKVGNVPVVAGYFVTDENSRGEKQIIYYAAFSLGEYTIYVEHSGLLDNSEAVRMEVATVVQKLIDNGEISFDS